jgi:hypothetical protein
MKNNELKYFFDYNDTSVYTTHNVVYRCVR